MPTILIGGYYGAGNIGDEAILASIVNELRAQKPNKVDLSFIVLSWDPEKTSRELDVGAIHWKDIKGLLDCIQKIDMIIVGGGGIFHDYWGIDPTTYLRKTSWDITAFGSLALLAKLLEIPCMIYAVGVGPFQTDLARYHTRLAFERCQVASVRDKESLDYLKQTGFDVNDENGPLIKVLSDPVFSLQTSSAEDLQVAAQLQDLSVANEQSLLGVSIHYWDIGTSSNDWLDILANSLRKFLMSNPQIDLVTIPFQVLHATPFTNDAIVLQQMSDLIDMPERVHIINERLTPGFAQALIKRCDLIMGMRLHSIIMGVNVNTPMVALASRPKVLSAMKMIGLEEYCCKTLTPSIDFLVDMIQKAWDLREENSEKLNSLREIYSISAKENASLALDLLSKSHRNPLSFSQEFVLKQVGLLNDLDEAYEELGETYGKLKQALQTRIWELQAIESDLTNQNAELVNKNAELTYQIAELSFQLSTAKAEIEQAKNQNKALSETINEMQSARVWKLGQRYYHLRDNTFLKYPYYFVKATRREGLKEALRKARNHQLLPNSQELPNEKDASQKIFKSIISELNARSLKGVFVLTSAFEFDEVYNQRVINLSKYLAREGWGVVYVAWVWQDAAEAPLGEVLENIFQIPSSLFLDTYQMMNELSAKNKYFIVEFPYPSFLTAAIKLRKLGFVIVYDIIDEWEEFHKVDQAIWFNKSAEEALVVNANVLTAVSQPLIEKFSSLRDDIHLIPNGFDPKFLGNHQGIAQRNFNQNKINLGYFGHLTPSWFDWHFLKEIISLSADKNIDIHIHLIGYGAPNIDVILGSYQDVITFYGKIHPSDLHLYVKDWDVAMIPFKTGKLSEAVDPIKIYEYLFFGLPVIVKGVNHLGTLSNVHVVSDAVDFVDVLNRLRLEKANQKTSLNLLQHTWDERFIRLLEILEGNSWMPL